MHILEKASIFEPYFSLDTNINIKSEYFVSLKRNGNVLLSKKLPYYFFLLL